ncbi:MAG TPA: maleylpyruvate isomerase N-terminal domain-containing protein [Candidatus Tectomicrobia bacterium]
MDTDADRAQVLHDEAQRLEAFLRTLAPADWQHPSRCDQWQVADVVAHLIEDRHADRITRGLQGDLTPSGFVPSGMWHTDAWRAAVVQHPRTLRRHLGDALLATFCAENAHVDTLLTGLQPEEWETLCYHPSGPLTVRDLVTLRLTEVAMHGWDIRASFDPQASLSEAGVLALVSTIPRVVRRVCRPDATSTRALRYRWHMTTPPTTTTDIVLNADGASVESDRHTEAADVILHCDTATAVLVIFGRLSFVEAIADGRVQVEGKRELVRVFGQSFKGGS